MEVRISTDEFWQDTNIQSVGLTLGAMGRIDCKRSTSGRRENRSIDNCNSLGEKAGWLRMEDRNSDDETVMILEILRM